MTEVLPFYLYGTARGGEPLFDWLRPIAHAMTLAKAPGTELLMHKDNSAYPYLVSHRPARKPYTWGDLMLLERGERLNEFVRMEIGVGYVLEGIAVEHDMPGVEQYALAFVWRNSRKGMSPLGSSSWLTKHLTVPAR